MKRIEELITAARQDTDNEDFDSTSGIGDNSFIRWANRAQDRVHGAILNVKPKPNLFQRELEQSAVAGQEAYTLPSDVYLSTRIECVEYSDTGLATDYYPLSQSHGRRYAGVAGQPANYQRQGTRVLLAPQPASAGKIRWTYQHPLPTLDKRRATVSAATVGATAITALTLDVSTFADVSNDIADILERGYLSVVDKDGVIKMKGIPVSAINETTGVVSVVGGSFTFAVGETVEVGDYVVRGKNATTHSQLPDVCEQYLEAFMNMKASKKDSANEDHAVSAAELESVEAQIVSQYENADTSKVDIPFEGEDGF